MPEKRFTFGFTLSASATVGAESREEAERVLSEILECATFTAWQSDEEDETVRGECSLAGEVHFYEEQPK